MHAAPRVLIVTPEVAYLPQGMSADAGYLGAKAGGLGDVSAALIRALYEQGADVHVTVPDYRTLFNVHLPLEYRRELRTIMGRIPEDRLHLAEDRVFFYLNRVYASSEGESTKIAIAFQREIINHIVPRVKPDLIHCNDWTTGLIPAMARQIGIPCLFSIHNLHSLHCTLEQIEDRGIDAAEFWQNLYFETMPRDYETSRSHNRVDFLVSGVFAAHFVNTVSPTFLREVVEGRHHFIQEQIRQEIANKAAAGCAVGILNAPEPSYDPKRDIALVRRYGPEDHRIGKAENKQALQHRLGLIPDSRAPLFFWPSRLDPVQKGCQLLTDILYRVVARFWKKNLQLVFVADGEYQKHFRDIVRFHDFHHRVAVCDYDEPLARLAYAASDFVLMPSSFEPCGLPQMIGAIYGSLPVVHDTGGLHDTVRHLDPGADTGNGFLFEVFDSQGLLWAMTEAVKFLQRPERVRAPIVARIMRESADRFNFDTTARRYMSLYEEMLKRPLLAMGPIQHSGSIRSRPGTEDTPKPQRSEASDRAPDFHSAATPRRHAVSVNPNTIQNTGLTLFPLPCPEPTS
jgi:starch synthase/alpha-amylase